MSKKDQIAGVALFLVAAAVPSVTGLAMPGTFVASTGGSGEGTYYGNAQDVGLGGTCSFGAINDRMYAALPLANWNNAAYCGACIEAKGPKGTAVVQIVDQCPTCASGDIDFSQEAFKKIANLVDGRVKITWTWTKCPNQGGPITYHWQSGSSQYWFGLQVRGIDKFIQSVEINDKSIKREYWNFFVGQNIGANPAKVKVSFTDGTCLQDAAVPVGQTFTSSGLTNCNGSPAVPPPPPAAPATTAATSTARATTAAAPQPTTTAKAPTTAQPLPTPTAGVPGTNPDEVCDEFIEDPSASPTVVVPITSVVPPPLTTQAPPAAAEPQTATGVTTTVPVALSPPQASPAADVTPTATVPAQAIPSNDDEICEEQDPVLTSSVAATAAVGATPTPSTPVVVEPSPTIPVTAPMQSNSVPSLTLASSAWLPSPSAPAAVLGASPTPIAVGSVDKPKNSHSEKKRKRRGRKHWWWWW